MRRARLVEGQDWDFSADSGEHLALHVVFERGVANRGMPTDTLFYSAKDRVSPDLAPGTGAGHPAQRDDYAAGSGARVLVRGIWWELCAAVRRVAAGAQLGQYPVDQSVHFGSV